MDQYDLPCFYDFFVPDVPNAHSRVYVVKILDSHPKYVFSRRFLPLYGCGRDGGQVYWAELDDFGVYERAVKWFADADDDEDTDRKNGGRFLSGDREWFVVMDGIIDHRIQYRRDVLPELQKLKKYLRSQGGDVA